MNEDIKKALEVLHQGGIILYPTDTIWGLGCDATNSLAVEKIHALKNRPENKSLIIFLASINQLEQYVDSVPELAYDLFEYATKPTTIILQNVKNVSPKLKAADGSVGIRIPKDDFCQKLLSRFKKPIVSTSANISGDLSPENYSEVKEYIINKVDYAVHWRQNERINPNPSSIIKLDANNQIKIIRE